MADDIEFGGNTTGMADRAAPDATGVFNPKTGRYTAFKQTTLLDPSAITTQRTMRVGHDETHPYGDRLERIGIAPASSQTWRNPQRHTLDREDV